jgi:hypothetical protein
MAVIEGWFSKSGSKWQTMPDLMLRYRAATFFCRLYAPEVTMGFQTAEEVQDVIDVTPPTTTTTDAQNIMDRFKSEEEIIEQTGEVVITAEEIKEVKAEVKTDEQKSLINDDDFIDPPKICSLCKKKGGKHSDSCPNATPETVE